MRRLFDAGYPVDERFDNRMTPLMFAAAEGKDECVKFLIEKGADLGA